MATGWGKRATTRIDRTQFDKDELLQSLGTQFNVDFGDYEQWTRKSSPAKRPPAPKLESKGNKGKDPTKSPECRSTSPRRFPLRKSERSRFSVAGRPISADSCQHGRMTHREKKQAAKLHEEEKERNEKMKILELRLKTRKKTLDEYEKRYAELIEQNILLKSEIENSETGTLDHVKTLLRKYEKYRGGIARLNTNFNKDHIEALEDLAATRERLGKKMGILEGQVAELDGHLKAKQEELHVLMNYKDKEYPVKAMRISNLQKEIQSLMISNEEDQEELEHITRTELSKYERERMSTQNVITKTVTEEAISMMHPSLKDMALQNMVMKKELEFHQKEQEQLERVNEDLEKQVTELLRDPKTNTRLQMFPEFFPGRGKCTPDMDVVLDIPTQEWLPI